MMHDDVDMESDTAHEKWETKVVSSIFYTLLILWGLIIYLNIQQLQGDQAQQLKSDQAYRYDIERYSLLTKLVLGHLRELMILTLALAVAVPVSSWLKRRTAQGIIVLSSFILLEGLQYLTVAMAFMSKTNTEF